MNADKALRMQRALGSKQMQRHGTFMVAQFVNAVNDGRKVGDPYCSMEDGLQFLRDCADTEEVPDAVTGFFPMFRVVAAEDAPEPQVAAGYVVAGPDGRMLVGSVAEDVRGAKVSGLHLITEGKHTPMAWWLDSYIENAWREHAKGYRIIAVRLVP